jgi:energy-coupling factor transporter ATP-binding protein EcfA2
VSSALNTSTSVGLSVSQLVIKYGNVTAVDHVSFTAQPGRVTVILGPNGAGKTSIIEACEGFLSPTTGSVQVLGLNPFLQRKQLNRLMTPTLLLPALDFTMLQAPPTAGCLVAKNNGFHWRLLLLHFPKSFFLMSRHRELTSMAVTLFAPSSASYEMPVAVSLLQHTNSTKPNALPMTYWCSIVATSLPLAHWMNCVLGVKKFDSDQIR